MAKKLISKPHPWHGIPIGKDAPSKVTAFIEMVPSDTCKYEIDKETGYLMIDRPQKFSNIIPALYGFVPKTYCGPKTAKFCSEKINRKVAGDCDPLDICVFTEREITHGNILVEAKVIGGMRMIDGGEADDKIIAVLAQDEVYDFDDIKDAPLRLINRLKHYFLTYKQIPGEEAPKCEITHVYGAEEAKKVIELSVEDYNDLYPDD
ncbi:inorganic pyrophosphatase [Flavobacteriales bacterium]|jgi:inorganic pyrophosphatase|nr:inorganic pyrophosphatase [Flavobacteriales bacterium]MDG1518623.1 inorganic pyrophosphatase [Flavobacteriales bacterium]